MANDGMKLEDIDIAGLGMHHLAKFLAKGKNRGENDVPDGPYDPLSEQKSESAGNPLAKLRQSLDEAKLAMAALNELRAVLRRRIRVLQKACMPLVLESGIKSLPDEMLSQVFEAGHNMTEGCEFAKTVSHVCHQFREISLRTPLLWTRISAQSSTAQNLAFISRSGEMGLDISTDSIGWIFPGRVESFFETLRPMMPRWSHLRLYEENEWLLLRILGFTDLPNLQFLYHECNIDFLRWQLPRLSRISGHNCYFIPGSSFVPSQLTSFEVMFEDVDLDVASLSLTLRSMVKLEDLSLTLKECSDLSVADVEVPIQDPHSFHISTLQLTIQDMTSSRVAEAIYDALSYLSASSVQITLENLSDISLGRGEKNVFPYGSEIIIRLSQVAVNYYPWNELGLLTELVKGCPIVEKICIEAPMVSVIRPGIYSETWNADVALRQLQFKYCDGFTEDELEDLVTYLMQEGEEFRSQSLETLYCRGISEDFLLDLSDADGVGQKLKWKL